MMHTSLHAGIVNIHIAPVCGDGLDGRILHLHGGYETMATSPTSPSWRFRRAKTKTNEGREPAFTVTREDITRVLTSSQSLP